eukprot:scaffold231771_cov31-Tisochrysis_lutea.AAC.11
MRQPRRGEALRSGCYRPLVEPVVHQSRASVDSTLWIVGQEAVQERQQRRQRPNLGQAAGSCE